MKRLFTLGFFCLSIFQSAFSQATLRNQNFNSLDPSFTENTDSIFAGQLLTNLGSFDNSGVGWNFETTYEGPDDKAGPAANESGDNIGVNSSTASGPNISSTGGSINGDYNFKFNDADNILRLHFEELDLSMRNKISWNLKFWINQTSYEGADHVYFIVTDGINELDIRTLTSDSLSMLPQDSWNTFSTVIDNIPGYEALDHENISFIVEVSNNANDENIFIDDVSLTADHVLSYTSNFTSNKLEIYPNPCSDYLLVPQSIIWDKMTILDARGSIVSEFQNSEKISTKFLNPGMYTYRLEKNKIMIQQERFIKH